MAATGTLSTSLCSAKITSTAALIPGFKPSRFGSSMMVSYFTTLPVHQPAGRVTAATDLTLAAMSPEGTRTREGMPALTRSITDS